MLCYYNNNLYPYHTRMYKCLPMMLHCELNSKIYRQMNPNKTIRNNTLCNLIFNFYVD